MKISQLIEYKRISVLSSEVLTLANRRLFNYLLHNAFGNACKKLYYEVDFGYLKGVFGVDKPSDKQLDQATHLLMRTLVKIQTINNVLLFPLLTEVSIDTEKETLHYAFSKLGYKTFSVPVLLEQCLIQAHFIHKYTSLIYELIAPRYYLNQDNKFEIDIQKLREYLGIEDRKLTNFSDFSRFVLQPSIKELNAHANFYLEILPHRIGRKVTRLSFNITAQRKISNLDDPLSIIPPMRPKLNFSGEKKELYAKILNSPTKDRQSYFDQAISNAREKDKSLDERFFDLPDLWLKWL